MRRSGFTRLSAIPASATRQNTTVNGPSAPSATLAKKNEPPHRTESDSNQIQTRQAHGATVAAPAAGLYPAAASNRCLVSAGPRMERTSKMPGDTVDPESATLSGWATWPSFTPCGLGEAPDGGFHRRLSLQSFSPSSAERELAEQRPGVRA